MELYLIRHGESTNNALADAWQRVCDPLLTDRGQQQARLVAEWLKNLDGKGPSLTRLYTSPMQRSLQTAEMIRQATGLTPQVWLDVHEHGGIWLDYGDARRQVGLPGLRRQEMEDLFPHFLFPAGIGEEGWWNRPWEDEESAFARAHRVAQELLQWVNTPERIGIVGHGAFGSSLMSVLLGLPAVPYERFGQHNTALSGLHLTPQRTRLLFLNRIGHLPNDLVT